MDQSFRCFEGVGFAVTVTDARGVIVAMNEAAAATFAAYGGADLIGRDVRDCHPEPARSTLERLLVEARPNHYTIARNGQRKVIHQVPYFADGAFAGLVELSIPVPDELPHFVRG